jgi:murein endopeptidase
MLARKWYQTFKKPLVINDISLPKGGLLDCKTPEKPNWNTPHSSHRKGIEADILSVSVPESVGRPSKPDDEKWLELYDKYNIFDRLKLQCLEKKKDYNHLYYTGK